MNNSPLMVEIIAYAPTAYYNCTHCEVVWKESGFSKGLHEEQVASALPPDLLREYQTVSDWARRIAGVQGNQVAVKVIDAASLEGVWKAARHGLRKFPAVLVDGQARFPDGEFASAEAEITRRLAEAGR